MGRRAGEMEGVVKSLAPEHRLDLRGRRVLVTGHTGFKGAWLCEWLLALGAETHGIALPPDQEPSLFKALGLEQRLASHILCDIRDYRALESSVEAIAPDLVFNLAAQALVLRSYREPLFTWETNVQGTLNLLEALRRQERPVTVVAVTSDKVYRNREWEFPYREEDELGGHDPYSASKAACEIAISSWRSSYGHTDGVTVVTARAGNVIGPGDYNENRIVPDCFLAWDAGQAVELRSPYAKRPWQHVLDPLSGYLALAAHTEIQQGKLPVLACNFGPSVEGSQTVLSLVSTLAEGRPQRTWTLPAQEPRFHEAHALALSTDRARLLLDWTPRLTFAESVAWTIEGYISEPTDLATLVRCQISDYEARGKGPR